MAVEFKLPEVSEGVESADVAELHVAEGDMIESGQVVMEVEPEKAVAEIECPYTGKVTKVHVAEGESVSIGAPLLTIEVEEAAETPDEPQDEEPREEESQEEKSQEEKPKKEQEEPEKGESRAADRRAEAPDRKRSRQKEEARKPEAQEQATETEAEEEEQPAEEVEQAEAEEPSTAQPEREESETQPRTTTVARIGDDGSGEPPAPAGPATRRLARQLGVDLHRVSGSGPGGRITSDDVHAFVRGLTSGSAADVTAPMSAPPLPDFNRFGPVERERLSKLARTAAANLSVSWQTIPHVTQHELADVTDLEASRRRYLQSAGQSGPKITMTAILVKAVVGMLNEFPQFNASLDAGSGELILKRYYHIGIAVDTEFGLLVPVIRDADQLNVIEIAETMAELAERARDRKLSMEEMQGGTFTITNLGGIGGTSFTPIIKYPEVAILGVSRSRQQHATIDGQAATRLMLPLSLSYDHRVINGADAARFVVRLSRILSDSFQLLIEC